MDDATSHPDQPTDPRRISTWCPDCDGKGSKWVSRAAVLDGMPAYGSQMQTCRTCKGAGKLAGFQPPV